MPVRKYSATPPVPARVRLELTARCDLQCLHCAGAMQPRRRADMDYAFFVRMLAQLRALGVRELDLSCLGEPFLCLWLPEAIRQARASGFESVSLTTNGRMATPQRVRECLEAGLDSLEFGCSFRTAEELHYITGAREEDFARLEANLAAARRVRDEMAARTGRRCAIVASTRCGAKPLQRLKGACPALFTEASITYDARLSACPYEHDPRFGMGELTCETFLEVWHDERFQRLREAHLVKDLRGTPCEGCGVRR